MKKKEEGTHFCVRSITKENGIKVMHGTHAKEILSSMLAYAF